MSSHTEEHDAEHYDSAAHIKAIWRTFWILFVVTCLEFLVAFSLPQSMHTLKVAIFIIMTFVKTFYIVGEFMHLKHEVKTLIWSIVIPVIFIVWFVIALLAEGGSIFSSHH